MRKVFGAGLLAVLIVSSGCQGGLFGTRPDEPCMGTYAWNTGSVPPPNNYGWELEINEDGTADFSLSAYGAEGGPLFEDHGFDVAEADVEALCDAIAKMPKGDEDMVGGPTADWEIGGMKGYSTNRENFAEATAVAIRIIGQERLDEAEAAHEIWAAEFE